MNQNRTLVNKTKTNEVSNFTKCYVCNKNFLDEKEFKKHMNNKFHTVLKSLQKISLTKPVLLEIYVAGKIIPNNVIVLHGNKKAELDIKLKISNTTSTDCIVCHIDTLEKALFIKNDAIAYPLLANTFSEIPLRVVMEDQTSVCEYICVGIKYPDEEIIIESKELVI